MITSDIFRKVNMLLHHVLPTWNVFSTTLFLLTTISIRHFKESQYTDVYQLRQTTTATIDYNSANKAVTDTAALCTISNTYANITKGTIIVIIESLLSCISFSHTMKIGSSQDDSIITSQLCEYSNNGFYAPWFMKKNILQWIGTICLVNWLVFLVPKYNQIHRIHWIK